MWRDCIFKPYHFDDDIVDDDYDDICIMMECLSVAVPCSTPVTWNGGVVNYNPSGLSAVAAKRGVRSRVGHALIFADAHQCASDAHQCA